MTPRQIASFAVGPIGGALLGLISLPIVAWYFEPDDIGRMSMMQVTISFSILFFTLGLDQAYVREYHETEDKPSLLKSVFYPGFMLLILFLIILSISPWSLSYTLFGIDSGILTALLITATVLQFISRFLSLILRMQNKGMAYSMSQLLPKLIFLLIILSYFVFNIDAIFQNLMIANLVSILAVFLIYAFNTRQDWVPALSAITDKPKQKQMLSFGFPLIGSGVAFWGLTAMDKFFIRGYSSFEQLGIYSVSLSFASAALVFQAVFSTVWAPIVYRWNSEGIVPENIKNVTDFATLAVIVLWCLAGMFSWIITLLLPSKYEQAQYIMLAAMAYPLLYTLSEATGVGVGVERKTIYALIATVSALVINAVGNWLLVPNYGAAGAAIASALAFFIFFIIRTEASSAIWYSFERKRMYFFMSLLILLSVIVNIVPFNGIIMFIFYGLTLTFSLLFFKQQSTRAFNYLSDRLKRFSLNHD